MHCFIFINYTYLHDIFSQCYIIQRAPPPPPLLPIGMICYYIYIFFSIIPKRNGDNFVQGYIKLKPLEYLVQTEVKMHLVLKKQNCTSKDFHFNSYVLLVHILKSFELQKKLLCARRIDVKSRDKGCTTLNTNTELGPHPPENQGCRSGLRIRIRFCHFIKTPVYGYDSRDPYSTRDKIQIKIQPIIKYRSS